MTRNAPVSERAGSETGLAERLFAALALSSADDPGVTRVAYGLGEMRAFAIMAEAGAEFGAEIAFDAAGNQFITLPGHDRSRRIVVGSHLDSVPHGGNYDGAAGVIMGICALESLARAGMVPAFDLTVACLRAEESCWFPHSYIGSKTALGRLEPGVLDNVRRSDTGRSLATHIAEAGFDPEAVRRRETFLLPGSIVAYLEPHIEQAPLLLSEGLVLGVVTGIRGSFRYRQIRIRGEYAHSGAMPRSLRHDCVNAGARLIVAAEALWVRLEAEGHDLTVTFGEVSTDPLHHSFSKVAGDLHLCLDVRSQSEATLALVEARLSAEAERIAAQTGTRVEFGPRSGSTPAVMADHLIDMAIEDAAGLGISCRRMASGAGHDAATFAQAGIPSVMLFVRNENGSHNPDEHMEMTDFHAALAVLRQMLARPAAIWLPVESPGE